MVAPPDTTADFQRLILLDYAAHHMYNTHGPQRASYELARVVEMAKTLKAGVDRETIEVDGGGDEHGKKMFFCKHEPWW